MTSCIAFETIGLCGLRAGAFTNRHTTKCFMRKMILQLSTDPSCFGTNCIRSARFSFREKYYNTRCRHKRSSGHEPYPYPIHNTRCGHKRSSGHERYPSQIKASLSCSASSKGTPERTRCPDKHHVNILEYCKLLLKVHVFRARRIIGKRQSIEELR